MNTAYHRNAATEIYYSALHAVDPFRLIVAHADTIRSVYRDMKAKRLVVAGFGKAASAMGRAVEDSLGDLIDEGILITGHGLKPDGLPQRLRIIEAGHPIPDEEGCRATEAVMNLLKSSDTNTLVLCLISGGGSAFLVQPYDGITLKDKQYVTMLLLNAGASISELNSVRKHISKVKGGRLAEIASPARVMSLILSDVIGDRMDVIASGPTSPDSTTYSDALRILEKYDLLSRLPESLLRVIGNGLKGIIPETPKEKDPIFSKVDNRIIGNNDMALQAARQKALALGFQPKILSSDLQAEARNAGTWLATRSLIYRKESSSGSPFCLLSGGETTVTVRGTGIGGRNMELALSFAVAVRGNNEITLLSAGTDGIDGPTDAAGAIVDGSTIDKAKALGLNPEAYLANNDSYTFFKKTGSLLVTGATGTNVMDIQIILSGKTYAV